MSFVKNLAMAAGLIALAVGLTTSLGSARDTAVRGTFNLPFEAHWGQAVLQPGEYTLFLPTTTNNFPVMYVIRDGKTLYIAVGPQIKGAVSDRSYLSVEAVGTTHVIRQFNSAISGELISFPIAKSVKNAIIAANENTEIPVSHAGGK